MFSIPHVPTEKELIDKSFGRGSKVSSRKRSSRTGAPREVRLMKADEARVQSIAAVIRSEMEGMTKRFPSYEQLPEFYQRLLDIQIDKDRYKKSLGALRWCSERVAELESEAVKGIRAEDRNAVKSFLGRTASIIKRISKDLDALIEIKMALLGFPVVQDFPTLVVAGYPNAGKSTFMRNLSGSNVKVASYPFTTKKILIGYVKRGHDRYQIIDSPGLLDRPMEKRNRIERQAVLAIRELADRILFLIDPIAELEPQLHLLEEIQDGFGQRVFVVVNKTDVASGPEGFMEISALREEDCREVFRRIFDEG